MFCSVKPPSWEVMVASPPRQPRAQLAVESSPATGSPNQ